MPLKSNFQGLFLHSFLVSIRLTKETWSIAVNLWPFVSLAKLGNVVFLAINKSSKKLRYSAVTGV